MSTDPESTLLIFGAGGHGRVVADAAQCAALWSCVVASDRDPLRSHGELLPGVDLLAAADALARGFAVHVAIGRAADRKAEVAALSNGTLTSVVHPHATVSRHARVDSGCFIAAQAIVAPGVQLGLSVIVNHGAVVDHDVRVGDFSHVAPNATLGGGVRVGQGVLIGSGSTVLPGLAIADGVTVGAGAVVCDNLPQAGVYAGVPARRLR